MGVLIRWVFFTLICFGVSTTLVWAVASFIFAAPNVFEWPITFRFFLVVVSGFLTLLGVVGIHDIETSRNKEVDLL